MPNEHIEWFKRFSAAYMRWVRFNFDRIASDAVKRHTTSEAVAEAIKKHS